MKPFWTFLIWLDRCVNALLGGSYDETLSGRAWRLKIKHQPYWYWTSDVIDALFFWQMNHCRTQYEAEYAAALVREARL